MRIADTSRCTVTSMSAMAASSSGVSVGGIGGIGATGAGAGCAISLRTGCLRYGQPWLRINLCSVFSLVRSRFAIEGSGSSVST